MHGRWRFPSPDRRSLGIESEDPVILGHDERIDLDHGGDFDEPVASSRVFMHRLLERMAVPVIWTANDIGVLGPAVLRRMTMCLELKVPNLPTRTRLWRRMGETEGLLLPEADAARLARRLVPAAPAVASAALRATRLAGGGADVSMAAGMLIERLVTAMPAAKPAEKPQAVADA